MLPLGKLGTTLALALAVLLSAAPRTFADIIQIPSDLQLIGSATTTAHPPTNHVTANTLPFTSAQSFSNPAEGFFDSATYNFFDFVSPSAYKINFSLNRTGDQAGNLAEAAGFIFFKVTADTMYALSGNSTVTSASSGHAEVFGSIYDVTDNHFVVNTFNNQTLNSGTLTLGANDPSAPLTGVLTANHTYEFHYSAYTEASDPNTTATAEGSFTLHLDGAPAQPAETPLPTVATAGLALFGVLSFSRTRRQPAR